jgi:hypothetical protein
MAHAIGISGSGPTIEYELSAGEHLQPQTITAAVDGSGAAGDFVVQVTIRNQAGDILTRTRSDDVVAAGDSGEVTFAPFVRAAGAAGGTLTPGLQVSTGFANIVLVSGVPRVGDWWSQGSSNFGGLFDPGFAIVTAATITPQLVGGGFYTLNLHAEWAAFAGTRYIQMESASMRPQTVRMYGSATPDDDVMDLTVNVRGGAGTPEDWTATLFQSSGVNRNCVPYMTGVYFPNPP